MQDFASFLTLCISVLSVFHNKSHLVTPIDLLFVCVRPHPIASQARSAEQISKTTHSHVKGRYDWIPAAPLSADEHKFDLY